jgi:hypothetical protein
MPTHFECGQGDIFGLKLSLQVSEQLQDLVAAVFVQILGRLDPTTMASLEQSRFFDYYRSFLQQNKI